MAAHLGERLLLWLRELVQKALWLQQRRWKWIQNPILLRRHSDRGCCALGLPSIYQNTYLNLKSVSNLYLISQSWNPWELKRIQPKKFSSKMLGFWRQCNSDVTRSWLEALIATLGKRPSTAITLIPFGAPEQQTEDRRTHTTGATRLGGGDPSPQTYLCGPPAEGPYCA